MVKGTCSCGYSVDGDLPSYIKCKECGELIDIPGGYDPFLRIVIGTEERLKKAQSSFSSTSGEGEKKVKEISITVEQEKKCIEVLRKKEWKWFLFDWLGITKDWKKTKKFDKVIGLVQDRELVELATSI